MKKLVFDVGASAIKYALMDQDATIYEKGKQPTPHESLDQFLAVLKDIYELYKDQIDGIALSIPGTVEAETGQIYAPGGLTYNENVNLADRLHTFADVPVYLENDGKSAALAEIWKGNLKDHQSGIVLVLGSGIGGGIVKDGSLWKGAHLFAGEFSYILGDQMESFMDVFAMKASTTALIMQTAQRKGLDMQKLNGIKVFEMIEEGDEDACAALQFVVENLAKGIFNLQCILDPEKVLIGGGISQQPILLEKLKEEMEALYAKIPFEIPHAQIDTCRYYNDSNLIGALYHLLNHM